MTKRILRVLFMLAIIAVLATPASAQCSVCTRSAQQLGEKPARGMNSGILYLAAAPFAIVGYIFYRWRKNEQIV